MSTVESQKEYGRIAGNHSINASIYRCFDQISREDVEKFVRLFKQQPHDGTQVMHTYRELLVGAFLASMGFRPRYEQAIGGRTPDWTLFDAELRTTCVLDVVTLHADHATEIAVARHWADGQVWCGFLSDHSQRLYSGLESKASRYCDLANQQNLPFAIALFGEFVAALDLDDVRGVLNDADGGLFHRYPGLSGILFFVEAAGRYSFEYIANPLAVRPMTLSSGTF